MKGAAYGVVATALALLGCARDNGAPAPASTGTPPAPTITGMTVVADASFAPGVSTQLAFADQAASAPRPSPLKVDTIAAQFTELKGRDYEVTPFGLFHTSCIKHVKSRDQFTLDGNLMKFDDEKAVLLPASKVPKCVHARYSLSAERLVEAKETEQVQSAWVAYAWADVPAASRLHATWHVPGSPKKAGAQTLYLFPGLQPTYNGPDVLQPVLTWQDGKWTIASWHCCVDGTVFKGDDVDVASGDAIDGTIAGKDCSGDMCKGWTLTTTASSKRNSSSVLQVAPGDVSRPLKWAAGGVLEVWNLDECGQYPTGTTKFSSVSLNAIGGGSGVRAWTPVTSPATSECHLSVQSTKADEIAIVVP